MGRASGWWSGDLESAKARTSRCGARWVRHGVPVKNIRWGEVRAGAPSRDRRGSLRQRCPPARAMTRRCRSSITTSSAGSSIRDSRQTRRPASTMAAGIVAASMARRCQTLSNKFADSSPANVVCRHAIRGTARRGSLFCEVKEEEEEAAGRRGTRTKQAPPVSRA